MQTPNENGVYQPETTETVGIARLVGARVSICECEDGLFRYSTSYDYDFGRGACGPITSREPGYRTWEGARAAGLEELVRRLPRPDPSCSAEIGGMLEQVRAQIAEKLAQPNLFAL